MTLWHASTELQATATAGVAKAVYLAAQLAGSVGAGTDRAELDTSG